MSKRTITLIAAVGVLAAVLLAYLILSASGIGKPAETTSEPPKEMLAEYDYKKVLSVGYTLNGTELNFTYNTNNGKWVCNEYPELPINLELPTYMASAISSIQAERFIEDTNEHFADFGLDDPYLTVTISYSDGVSCEYNVGDYNSTTGTYYFNVGGTNKVYTIASGLTPYFEYSLLDLVQPETLPMLYSTTFALTSVTIGDRELTADEITAYKPTLGKANLGAPVGWAITDSEIANYGLDNPTVVTIKYNEAQNVSDSQGTISSTIHVEGDTVLYIGKDAGEGKLYCMTDASPLVYRIADVVLFEAAE